MARYVGTELRFFVTGEPVPWARARRRGNRYFTPQKQKAHMERVAMLALHAVAEHETSRKEWWELSVEVEVIGRFSPSKSWPQWKKKAALAGTVLHRKKPDADNLVKLVKDALSGVIWRDDSLVVDQIGRKRFSDAATTEIILRPLFDLGDHES